MTDNYEKLSIALAGILQATSLVHALAQSGKILDQAAYEGSIYSIFQIDAQSPVAIYQDLTHLKIGLNQALTLLAGKSDANLNLLTRYVLGLMHLERKLRKSPTVDKKLTLAINKAIAQKDFFTLTHPNTIARLADIYTQTLSTFNYRLHIVGNPLYLKDTDIINKIRTLLLAGIRATVLWQQLGGSRWKLFFARKKLMAALKVHLNNLS